MYQWILKPFSALHPEELYAALRLRSRVFVVEQNCVFLDLDDKDQLCHHLMGWAGHPAAAAAGAAAAIPGGAPFLAAYARIVPPGVSYPEPSIGRVVTAPEVRGLGAGKALMEEAIAQLYALFGDQPIRIGAQQYLERFYGSLGFAQTSEMYLEDDIPHIEMTKK
jgi:ElaA protein